MTDRFWINVGKTFVAFFAVFGLWTILCLCGLGYYTLAEANRSYQHDTTPLLAPDSTRAKKVTP